ncbi:hypothetical protein G1H11_04385 [Phytoactinopolyspora alkaliphila]|uniref:Lipase family protein n=1 Tax=Phytoactinopolyspora alkaliphila TaxID=1783498 RepID=A0A6N9YHV1_9ACTN|nr:hypothetical protein [Phytoactinopolyspora alkaliphila]NED94544.1 hypothetical protein [Phytoactinopolyspora alkaliphila]
MVRDDASLDTSLDGSTELRVHGVSGTPPETVLDHPLLKRVAGDERAGFYRRWYPGGRSADLTESRRLEAYGWGNLTSGPAARAAWLMLLPFMLVNLAHWMLPAIPAGAGRLVSVAGRASATLLRLFGVVLSITLVLTAVQAAMDVAGWQCAGHWRCGSSSPVTAALTDGWLSEPGRRVVVSGLVPMLVVLGIAMLGRKPLRRSTSVPEVPVATERDRPMTHAAFWKGNPGLPALRSAHVAAATALLAATIAWPATTLAASGPLRVVGVAICIAALATLATAVVAVAVEGIAGRGAHHSLLARAARSVATVLLILGVAFSLWDHGAWESAGRLPGTRAAILVTFVVGIVILALLTATVAVQRPWSQGRGGFRVSMRGLGAPAVAVVAYLIAGGFSAGLTYRVTDLLGYPVLSQATANAQRASLNLVIADESLPFATRQAAWSADIPLVLPPSFAWAGAAAAVIFAAILVIVALVALGVARRIGPVADVVAAEHNAAATETANPADPPAPAKPADPAVRRVALVVALASLTDGAGRIVGRVVLVAGLVLLAGLAVYVGGADNWRLIEEPPLSTLTAFGTWFMGAFALGLIGLAWSSARKPALRRTVGILWDIGSFWPRAAHPLAPPSYGERAVPDLVERITALNSHDESRVVLSGHSQGSILAVATVLQLPAGTARHVHLVTHGSPARRLYARHFPAYVDERTLRALIHDLGSWRNLYRDTDPIGAWILDPPRAPDPAVDRRLLDPPTLDAPIAGHGEYWLDPRYVEELTTLTTSVQPGHNDHE